MGSEVSTSPLHVPPPLVIELSPVRNETVSRKRTRSNSLDEQPVSPQKKSRIDISPLEMKETILNFFAVEIDKVTEMEPISSPLKGLHTACVTGKM